MLQGHPRYCCEDEVSRGYMQTATKQDVEANIPEDVTDEMSRRVAMPSSNPMQSEMRERDRD